MKYLLILLLLPCLSFAQYDNLKYENKQVLFEKVYNTDSSANVRDILIAAIPQMKGIRDVVVAESVITAKIETTVDFKKYGGKSSKESIVLFNPLWGNVSFYWKEGKYRVVVSNMVFQIPLLSRPPVEDILIKKETWNTKPVIARVGSYLEKHLSDLFAINSNNDW